MFYWFMKNLVAGPILKTVFRPWVTGLENIPATGGVILASNHLSFIDSVFLPLVIDRRIFFLAKSDYFKGRGDYASAFQTAADQTKKGLFVWGDDERLQKIQPKRLLRLEDMALCRFGRSLCVLGISVVDV